MVQIMQTRQRLRSRAAFLLAGGLLCGATLLGTVSPASATEGGEKVTICHAAGRDGTDKYVTLTVSTNAVYKEQGGHFYENGTPRAGHEDDYFGSCKTVVTTVPTTVPTTETTVGETTTTVGETTTTETDHTTTTVGDTVTVPSTDVTIGTPQVITRPTVPKVTATAEPTADELPATGMSTAEMAMVGAGLVLIGYGALMSGRKPDEIQ